MPYCDERKIFWYTPARTASRSCAEIIAFLKFSEVRSHNFITREEQMGYHLICNTRSPYTRLVSLYQLKKFQLSNNIPEFVTWLKNRLTYQSNMTQFEWDRLHPFREIKKSGIQLKEIIKQENLLEDVLKLNLTRENLNPTLFKLINDKIIINLYSEEHFEKKNWFEYYNQEISDLISKNFEYEFDMFGYNLNYWKDGTP